MTALYIFAALVVIVAFFVIAIQRAPDGYQDETGFHFGRKP